MVRFCKHLVTSAVIKSNPKCIINFTSLGVKCLTGRYMGRRESRYIYTVFVVAGKKISGWGWNILWRWFLNSSAFSTS